MKKLFIPLFLCTLFFTILSRYDLHIINDTPTEFTIQAHKEGLQVYGSIDEERIRPYERKTLKGGAYGKTKYKRIKGSIGNCWHSITAKYKLNNGTYNYLDLLHRPTNKCSDRYAIIELKACQKDAIKDHDGNYCYHVRRYASDRSHNFHTYWKRHGKDIQKASKDGTIRKNYYVLTAQEAEKLITKKLEKLAPWIKQK